MPTFDDARWAAVGPYLDQALTLPEHERAAWVAALAAEQPGVAADLAALLEEHRALSAERFLEGTAEGVSSPTALEGQIVGAYRLTSLIGHGGMGSVWRAERIDGRFERHAAVKFLNLALIGRGEERFRREGHLLARLSHPNIAQLVDAGVSPAGAPYLVLEYVEGEPLDRYCDRQALDVGARVSLFLDVLAAVQHAHASLVVHRDLKPSNVLVTREGCVKLLDFGIAKLLEPEAAGEPAPALTLDGGAALTPEYAAPEQLTGGFVSTATDIYALGVMLFVLLAGRHPAGEMASTAALVEAVVQREPPRASAEAGDARRRRALRGDLDTILAKALNKRPEDRYATAAAMAEDLRRYLRHEPISARPDAIAYRAIKFLRRRPVPVGVAAVFVVAVAAGLFVVNRERAVAQERFDHVRGLASSLFEIDARVRQLPGAAATRQLIVDTALDYLQRLAGTAEGDPALALDLGTAYMRVARVQGVPISPNLGQAAAADENLRHADRLLEQALAHDPGNRLALLRSAQVAHDRMILAGARRPADEALPLAERAAARLERYLAGGPVDPAEAEQVVIVAMNVANRFILEGREDEGIRLAERTILIAQETSQPGQAAAAMMVLAAALRGRGDLGRALEISREATDLLEPPPGTATLGRQLTYVLALIRQAAILGEPDALSLDRPAEAVPLLERAIELTEGFARADPNDTFSRERMSVAARHLAGILSGSDPARALGVYDRTLARLAEITDRPRARRDEARLLARSTYPLRLAGRGGEAPARLAVAFERLRALDLYPADSIALGSELDDVMRAAADDEAARGQLVRARDRYRTLHDLVMASQPQPEDDLADAVDLSRLYRSLAGVEQRLGASGPASELRTGRLALWQHWDARLPGNAFVRRQLEAAAAEAGASAPQTGATTSRRDPPAAVR